MFNEKKIKSKHHNFSDEEKIEFLQHNFNSTNNFQTFQNLQNSRCNVEYEIFKKEEIVSIIKQNKNTAPGINKINNRTLKFLKDEHIEKLTTIYNYPYTIKIPK